MSVIVSEWWARFYSICQSVLRNQLTEHKYLPHDELTAALNAVERIQKENVTITPEAWEYIFTAVGGALRSERSINPCPRPDPLTT